MIVTFSADAEDDLEGIGDYIGRDDFGQAGRFVLALRERCLSLSMFPERFPLLPGLEAKGVRRFSYRKYLVFFRVEGDEVEILHVLHGTRDYFAVLFPG